MKISSKRDQLAFSVASPDVDVTVDDLAGEPEVGDLNLHVIE